MALEPNTVQPNAVVKFDGNLVTVISVNGNVVTLGNHETGVINQVYLDFLVENGEPNETPESTPENETQEVNPTGYDPVTGKPNPPSDVSRENPSPGV